MHVHIDQPRQQRLARAFDHVGAQLAGVGTGAIEDVGDLAVVHQHAGVLLHRAIAEEEAGVANQKVAGAREVAHDGLVLADVLLGMRAPAAHDDEGREHAGHPQAIAPGDLLLLLPAEELHGEKQAHGGGEEQSAHRGGVVKDALIAEENALEAAHQVSCRQEFRQRLRPGGQNRRRNRGAAQEEHWHVQYLDQDIGFRHGIGDGREDQTDRAERADPQGSHQHQRDPMLRQRHGVNDVRQPGDQRDHRQIQQQSARHRRYQNRKRRYRRHFEAAQNVGLAILHGAHARAPESVAQDAHGEHRAHEIGDALTGAGVEQFGESEEENQRENVVEE